MKLIYSNERAAQMLVSLLKQHNIKKIVASPGATNITFVATAMHDPWFEIYSSVDERSAAYIACGLAEEAQGSAVRAGMGIKAENLKASPVPSQNHLPSSKAKHLNNFLIIV